MSGCWSTWCNTLNSLVYGNKEPATSLTSIRKLRQNKSVILVSAWEMAGRKATVIGEVVKHTAARTKATCEISAPGFTREDVDVNILSPSKIPVSYRWGWEKLVKGHWQWWSTPVRLNQSQSSFRLLIPLRGLGVFYRIAGNAICGDHETNMTALQFPFTIHQDLALVKNGSFCKCVNHFWMSRNLNLDLGPVLLLVVWFRCVVLNNTHKSNCNRQYPGPMCGVCGPRNLRLVLILFGLFKI